MINDIKNEKIRTVKFNSPDEVLSFVQNISKKIPCDVNAFYENRIVDAKSLLGMLGMPKCIICTYAVTNDKDILKDFDEICDAYLVRKRGNV